MTYDALDISIMITTSNKAAFARDSRNHLIVIQEKAPDDFTMVDLGHLTQARAKELKEYLDRLAIHVK